MAGRGSRLAQAGLEPVEVRLAGGIDLENQELGRLVAVQFMQTGLEGGELFGAGLEQQQRFRRGLDLALPAVDGLDGGNERGAGDEALLDQRAAQACGLVGVGRGGEDDAGWGVG